MADVFTSSTSNASVLISTALDLQVRWYLLRQNVFRQFADAYPVDPSYNYKQVTLTIHGELALATTALSETVNPDAVDIPTTRQVTVTMNEYGNTMKHTLLLDRTAWDVRLPEELAFMLAQNAVGTTDKLVQTQLDAGTNVLYVDNTGAFSASLPTTTGTMTGKILAAEAARLRTRRALPQRGVNYACVVHPLVGWDIRVDAGANAWAQPHQYQDKAGIYNGVTGSFGGVDVIEANTVTTGGAGVQSWYQSYFIGSEALIEAVAIEPHLIPGPIIDPMMRIAPVSWHGLLGWNVFRQNSLDLLRTNTGIGTAAVPGALDPKA